MRHIGSGKSSRNSGISIVEVLVAISISVVMIIALIPALSRAREAARSAVCISNLWQIGVALGRYAEDNSGYLPQGQYLGFSGAETGQPVFDLQSREWMRIYYPYLLAAPINPSELTNPYSSPDIVSIRKQITVFDCPSTNNVVGHFHPVTGYKSQPKALDYLVFTHKKPSSAVLINKLARLPRNAFLLMDARETDPIYSWGNNADPGNDNYFLWQLLYIPQANPAVDGYSGYRPGFHHQAGNNTLFPDGSAQHLDRTQVQPNYLSGNYTTRITL